MENTTKKDNNGSKQDHSRFKFTTERPVAIIMIVLGIAVFGIVSYLRLSWDLMPDISYPSFTVRTEYPGAAPEEVENVVSRVLEEQLSLIKDLVSITSVSRPEQSDIILEFTWGADLDRSAQEIREKLGQIYLDPAVKKPVILRYDPALDPVLRIGIVSNDETVDPRELRVIVEDEIARELESLPGVAAARVKGGFEKEILIKLDETKLASTQIRFNQITNRLAQENINLAGGNIKEGETEYIVRTLNEFRSVKEIGDIIVVKRDNVLVYLKDIAEISYSHKERTVITRVNKKESIEIDIHKEADSNIVSVSNLVKDRLFGTAGQQAFAEKLKEEEEKLKAEEAKAGQPGKPGTGKRGRTDRVKKMMDFLEYQLASQGLDVSYYILSDQATFIENSINEVRNTAVYGGIFAILILFLFLRHFSTTLIVAVSIPLSLLAAFGPLDLFNVSLNIMSLGGLALGIGMLVDNSIVVMESIFRCREEGDGWKESAVRGVSEVGGAVIASTLTTIAVFFPIVFVEGIAGQIFGDLSLAVVFSLLASLMISLFFIPMLASREFKKTEGFSMKRFDFQFENKHSIKNYLMVIPQMTLNVAALLLNLAVVLVLILVASLAVFLYPLLALLRVHKKTAALFKTVTGKYPKTKLLWDQFITLLPFEHYVESMSTPRSSPLVLRIIFWPFAWMYYILRYLLAAMFFVSVRLSFTFLGIFITFIKALLVMLLAFIVPVAKLVTHGFNKVLTVINNVYPKLLGASLKKATELIGIVLIIFALTLFVILPRIGTELVPEVHQGTLYVNMTFPVGTPVEKNDQRLQQMSRQIRRLPDVQSISYYAGTTKEEINEDEVGEHIGRITVVLEKSADIKASEQQLINRIRGLFVDFTDLDYNISRPVLFTMKPPIEVILKGYDLRELRRISRELYDRIALLPGLKDVQTTVKPGFPELVVEFDRMRLSHYGMNAFDVASLIKNKIEGFVATRYKEKDRRVDIRVYLKDEQRRKAENIKNLIVNPGGAIPIQLKGVANVSILSGPNEIRRVDQDRSAVISANIANINLAGAIQDIYDVIESYPLPPGIRYELSGQNKEMKTSMNSLAMAMALAVFMVYIVMASQFESFMHPFLILFTIPMALIGVFLTLYVLAIPIGITVYIGMITLVGIVVNNAIILIDYINTLRKRGMEKLEAIMQAGKVRLRPILITTSTTVLGLLPMALGLGEGAEIRVPMAVSVIAGLLSATFLTLILIPVVYNKFSK
ncbi:MAG: efflux RND transporter permease subunit [bacterium]|nr:efflux RND transporter permease subunit [bacterium]